jgi:UvrD/REP helicase N-terminal domain
MPVDAVLKCLKGLVVAPAGCGKTHLIIKTLNVKPENPYLVLTHTTAGVAAIKKKLKEIGVPNFHYRVTTIDSWAVRIAKIFPASCPVQSTIEKPGIFYPQVRRAVSNFIGAGHLSDIINASYSKLLVDEYQDCDDIQHNIVCELSKILSTVVFGDPMQAIFDFGNNTLPCWESNVQSHFPQVASLDTPWRWNNAGKHRLGQWILHVRSLLIQGNKIDLNTSPNEVTWYPLTGNFQDDAQNRNNAQYQIRKDNPETDSILVIGDPINKQSRYQFAKMTNGIDVVEPVDLTDVVSFANQFDANEGITLVERVLNVAGTMMTGIGSSKSLNRLKILIAGTNRKPPSNLELAALSLAKNNSRESILQLLDALENNPNTKVYRKVAFSALKAAVSNSIGKPDDTIHNAAKTIREQRRQYGDRRIPLRAIGSTLLLKGLEADHAMILNADIMNNKNLYVALSRGAKSITIFSKTPTIGN